MRGEQWRRVEQLYQAAAEQKEDQRAAFLESSCAGDDVLRAEVESLLAYGQQTSKFIDSPALERMADLLAGDEPAAHDADSDCSSMIGKKVGPYRIAAKLGSGGMGDVFRAVRADEEYETQVALKLVSAGRHLGFFISRFRKERQILARLNHPNIARLFDGGTTSDGTPYFVMELIAGVPIDEYCHHHQLPISERLKLFMQVCAAVQYAHQRLIIHRDIKPVNILVTSEGVPKLMDFGIAKFLNQDEEGGQNATVTALRAFTPGYASPEQVKGEPVTTASDVYSLGVVLYELLTGNSPYRLPSYAPHEIARAVCDAEPEKPSTAVMRNRRSRSEGIKTAQLEAGRDAPEKWKRRLSGELDNIVLMALRKEPQRRYASAEDFKEDIRRHLEDLPVIAQTDTPGYRAAKFIRRHRMGVGVAIVVCATLLGALAVTRHEAHIAEQRFNDVRELANSLMFDVHDSIKDLAGATPARKLLVTKALVYLEKLSQDASGDASLQRELATAYEKIGDVQGNPNAANLGDTAGAIASYRKAVALRQSAALIRGGSREAGRDLALDYERLASVLSAVGESKAALEYAQKDLDFLQKTATDPADTASQSRLGGAYFLIARCYARLQDPKNALENYVKSAAILEPIAASSKFAQTQLAGTYGYMAPILRTQGDLGQAAIVEGKSLNLLRKLYEGDPTNATYREFRDEAYYWTGFYLEQRGNFSEAITNYRDALSDFQVLATKDPQEIRTKRYLAICYKSIGTSLVSEGRYAQGVQSIRKALPIVEELPRPQYTSEVADTYDALGFAYSRSAAQPGGPRLERIAAWNRARAAYQMSMGIYLEMQSRGAITTFGAGNPQRLKDELMKCDAALARLKAPAETLNQ